MTEQKVTASLEVSMNGIIERGFVGLTEQNADGELIEAFARVS